MAERNFVNEQFAALGFELNLSRAAVLGRYGRQADAAIATCQTLLERMEAGDTTAAAAYEEQRRAAIEAVDGLCLQFEMLRIYDHTRVHESYPVPPPIREMKSPVDIPGSSDLGLTQGPIELSQRPTVASSWWSRIRRR